MKTTLEVIKDVLIKYNVRQYLNINNSGYSLIEREIADKLVTKTSFRIFGIFCLITGIMIGVIL